MRFSNRRILRRRLEIFNATGTVMQLIIRTGSGIPPAYDPTVSGNLFTAESDPPEDSGDYTFRYIRGRFDETDDMEPGQAGRLRVVKGIITVPILFKSLLAQAEYIDPYLDKSRFSKTGAIINEGRTFCTVTIQSVYLTSTSEVT